MRGAEVLQANDGSLRKILAPAADWQAVGARDGPGLLLAAASFFLAVAVSWQRWGNPLVDCGREMNVPLRLARGQMLYSDVRYIYGPLSPYFYAALYRIFHPSLSVLYAGGLLSALVILALVYWIARQILGRAAAFLAVVAVTWICAFKPAGNYVFAYSYSAVQGCALGLAALALLVRFVQTRRGWLLPAAGICTGLAALAKTEMGVAPLAAGVLSVFLAEQFSLSRSAAPLALFLALAAGIPAGVCAWFAGRTGWHALAQESYLFFTHVPWQLVYFNQVRFGFAHPWTSLALMLVSLVRLLAVAGLLVVGAMAWPGSKAVLAQCAMLRYYEMPGQPPKKRALASWALACVALIALASWPLGDSGAFLPMPLILLCLIGFAAADYWRAWKAGGQLEMFPALLLLIAVYALASLLRIVLRVSTGGALSSDLLPAAVILFVYCWTELLPQQVAPDILRRRVRGAVLPFLALALLATAAGISAQYLGKRNYALRTPRGTMRVWPSQGRAFTQAITFIEQNTEPGDFVAVLPEGTSLDFLTGRRNPLREEIVTPGFLDAAGEERAIRRLQESHTRLLILANRGTVEFGQAVFGRDYDQNLMRWVRQNFAVCGNFGAVPAAGLQVGDANFFLRAYCRPASSWPKSQPARP